MAMWGLFQVINVVVLLNVCVALMNNTMIIINEEQCITILTLIQLSLPLLLLGILESAPPAKV